MATLVKKTVAPSGGDFTTLTNAVNWFKTNYPDFVTSDIYGEIEITGSWSSADTSSPAINSIVTGPNNYLHIYTDSSNKASASWSGSKYILNGSGIDVAIDYLIIDGLQFYVSAANADAITVSGTFTAENNQIILRNLLVKGNYSDDARRNGILIKSGNALVYVYNCIVYNFYPSATYYNYCYYIEVSNLTCYNSLAIGGCEGFTRSSGTVVLKNCYAGGSYSSCYSGTMTKVTCASSDTTGSSGLQNIALADAGFVNINSGSEDFHLATPTSPLYHTGTDTSGDSAPMNFTTDIDGDNYYDTGGVRSIGVDEYVEGGEPTGPYRSVWINFSWS